MYPAESTGGADVLKVHFLHLPAHMAKYHLCILDWISALGSVV